MNSLLCTALQFSTNQCAAQAHNTENCYSPTSLARRCSSASLRLCRSCSMCAVCTGNSTFCPSFKQQADEAWKCGKARSPPSHTPCCRLVVVVVDDDHAMLLQHLLSQLWPALPKALYAWKHTCIAQDGHLLRDNSLRNGYIFMSNYCKCTWNRGHLSPNQDACWDNKPITNDDK